MIDDTWFEWDENTQDIKPFTREPNTKSSSNFFLANKINKEEKKREKHVLSLNFGM